MLQIQTRNPAELFRQLISTKQEEVWAVGPVHRGAPSFSAAPGSAGQHYACVTARRTTQILELQNTELKPGKASQNGCRAVISSGCSTFPCKEEALSASSLKNVALLTHRLQNSDTALYLVQHGGLFPAL